MNKENEKKNMNTAEFDRESVVINYYKAETALTEIGITPNIPEELKQLAINALVQTIKIIDFINNHK